MIYFLSKTWSCWCSLRSSFLPCTGMVSPAVCVASVRAGSALTPKAVMIPLSVHWAESWGSLGSASLSQPGLRAGADVPSWQSRRYILTLQIWGKNFPMGQLACIGFWCVTFMLTNIHIRLVVFSCAWKGIRSTLSIFSSVWTVVWAFLYPLQGNIIENKENLAKVAVLPFGCAVETQRLAQESLPCFCAALCA